jgi:hypothetical protein
MKVYFVASPRSANKEPEVYKRMYRLIQNNCSKMVSDMVLEFTKVNLDDFYNRSHKDRVDHFKNTMDCVKKADVVVVEVSEHSMSMGYIVNKAVDANKPVVALYKHGNDPYFFSGIEDGKLLTLEYTNESLERVIKDAFENVKNMSDVRFNFFVSPKILAYLDWVAQKRMIPRSVFLRDLIEKEMKKDKEFKG